MIVALLMACGSGASDAIASVANPLLSVTKVDHVGFDAAVTERVGAGPYSYLHLDDGRWVVGLDKGTEAGDRVHVVPIGFVDSFHSPRTDRTFAPLWFGVLSPGS